MLICNTGATFQRVIEKVIQGIDNSTAYIDDLFERIRRTLATPQGFI